MDHDAIVTRIGTTPGVTHAEVRPFNLGAPGSNALAVVIDVDHTGDAALGDVIVTAVRSVAEHASGFRDYEFTVNVPGAAGLEVERLRDRRTEIPIDVGTYQGSALILTEAELRRAAG